MGINKFNENPVNDCKKIKPSSENKYNMSYWK